MSSRQDLSFCVCKTACLAPELLVFIGHSPHLWFLHAKQRILDKNYKYVWVPDLTCPFVHAKQRGLHQNDKSIWFPALISGFVNAKQRLLGQTYKSVWVPDLICGFEHT